jgi:pimeloyl-ACP methyl ester carboxylesterase
MLVAAIVVVLVGGFAWLSLTPLRPIAIPPDHPAGSYDEAIATFRTIAAREATLPLHPRCHSTLLTHGRKTALVVVFFHGLTNCPAQADELASQLFDLGYNVYIPRLPGHGEADPLTLALVDMTAEDLVNNAQTSVDMAQGLGDEVVVIGLSAGGTVATWLAQSRADVGNAIPVAPFLGLHFLPSWADRAAANLLLVLPNMMVWWDPSNPMGDTEMDYAYPRYATHALGEVLRLGGLVQAEARYAPPAAQRLGMLLNAADFTVSNARNESVIAAWRSQGRDVTLKTLPLEHGLPHDLIDPRQADADVAFVYPILIGMIGNQADP